MSTRTVERVALAASVAALLLGGDGRAHAYTEPRTYFEAPEKGGGGGRWFTGSPAEGYDCSVCHRGRASESLQVEGLPEDGYVPGESYDVELSWPAFAAKAREIRETDAGPASAGLVAELVAETGEGSGAIEVAAAEEAEARERCVLPAGQQAAQLFGVRPGEAVSEEGTHCEATGLGARCVVAVLACGAEALRFRWTSPTTAQGAIWLSAGFVATERVSGTAKGDAVTEVLRVIRPATSAGDGAVSTLHAACSVDSAVGSRAGHGDHAWLALVVSLVGLLLARIGAGTRKRVLDAAVALWFAALAPACAERDDAVLPARVLGAYPKAGLFTPGSRIGAAPDGAVDAGPDAAAGLSAMERRAIEQSIVEAGGEDRCAPTSGKPGTKGVLTVEFQTASYDGFYEPKNVGVVWIEDAAGAYVATPLLWGALRTRDLFVWAARRCRDDAPDVVSSATLRDHSMVHDARWDGRDRAGGVAPDGAYVLNVEVTEDEFNFGRRTEVPFVKGAKPQDVRPGDAETVRGLVLAWTPRP